MGMFIMDAGPLLESVLAALDEVRLEAIVTGNAAGAIQGSPVTPVGLTPCFAPRRPIWPS